MEFTSCCNICGSTEVVGKQRLNSQFGILSWFAMIYSCIPDSKPGKESIFRLRSYQGGKLQTKQHPENFEM